jgi:hypothetical protein
MDEVVGEASVVLVVAHDLFVAPQRRGSALSDLRSSFEKGVVLVPFGSRDTRVQPNRDTRG